MVLALALSVVAQGSQTAVDTKKLEILAGQAANEAYENVLNKVAAFKIQERKEPKEEPESKNSLSIDKKTFVTISC